MQLDIHFWEGLCFVVFIALVYKPVKGAISNYLDKYSESVRLKLREADSLREDAEKTFKYYTSIHKNLMKKIATISKHTDTNIKALKQQAADRIDEQIKVRQQMQKDKLDIYHKEETRQIKEQIVKKTERLVSVYLNDDIIPNLTREEITQLLITAEGQPITFH